MKVRRNKFIMRKFLFLIMLVITVFICGCGKKNVASTVGVTSETTSQSGRITESTILEDGLPNGSFQLGKSIVD